MVRGARPGEVALRSVSRIDVTRSLVPPIEVFVEHVRRAFEQGRFTNHGPLVAELEQVLRLQLEVPYGAAVCNGTLALQLACAALGVTGEVPRRRDHWPPELVASMEAALAASDDPRPPEKPQQTEQPVRPDAEPPQGAL